MRRSARDAIKWSSRELTCENLSLLLRWKGFHQDPQPTLPMNPLRSDDLPEPDPTTHYTSMPSMRFGQGDEEWALIRYVGEPVGEVIALRPPGVTIGRSSRNDVSLPEAEVSRHHAQMSLSQVGESGYMVQIMDLNSTNGSFINGRRIEKPEVPIALQHGDVVRVGAHAFKLKRLDALERHYHEAMMVQTSQDTLTGVNNRSVVLAFLEKHADLARRYRRPLSVVLADLDYFKSVNDRFGHATGDLALEVFGSLVMKRLRTSDLVGRIGGEEFLIVMPETRGQEAVGVAEALRQAVSNEVLTPCGGGDPFQITCCFGAAQLQTRDINGGSLLARADAALYRAKALGRNRVESDA
jgi:two-component system cell cycle response regulator